MHATTVAVDLAKDVFEVALADRAHRIVDRKRLTRRQFEAFLDGLSTGATVIMEACGTAHYWGRRCLARGLTVRLLPVQYVRPYVRRNKTDRTDTEAMLEANRCAGVHPVPVKTVEQQGLQSLHRVRTQWQATRTGRINVIRGLLREHGCPVPVGARTMLARVTALLEDSTRALPMMLRQTVAHLVAEVRDLEARVAEIDRELARVAREHVVAIRLQQMLTADVATASGRDQRLNLSMPTNDTMPAVISGTPTASSPQSSADGSVFLWCSKCSCSGVGSLDSPTQDAVRLRAASAIDMTAATRNWVLVIFSCVSA